MIRQFLSEYILKYEFATVFCKWKTIIAFYFDHVESKLFSGDKGDMSKLGCQINVTINHLSHKTVKLFLQFSCKLTEQKIKILILTREP